MTTRDTESGLRDLLIAFIDGALSQADAEQLNRRLKSDALARTLYLDLCSMHTALTWEHGVMITAMPPKKADKSCITQRRLTQPAPTQPVRIKHSRTRSRPWLSWRSSGGIAALLAILIGLGIFLPATQQQPIIGHISNRVNVELYKDSTLWHNDQLPSATYELRSGLLGIIYGNDVRVVVEAPARFTLTNAIRLDLTQGRLSSHVPPSGIGFMVMTPQAEVIDLGTEFGVEVADDGQSEVHVFEGLVTVRATKTSPAQRMEVKAKQAVRIANNRQRPTGIDLDNERFFRSFNEPTIKFSAHIRRLSPIAFYRMGVSDDYNIRNVVGNNPGHVRTGSGRQMPWSPGMVGSALRMGGKSIGRGLSFAQPPINTTKSFTYMAWVRAESRVAKAVLMRDEAAGANVQFGLDESGNYLTAFMTSENNIVKKCQNPQPLQLNTWYHVTVVGDGITLRLFIDGNSVAEVPCPQPLPHRPTTTWWVGSDANSQYIWDGCIDELAIFYYALSENDIRTIATMREK